VSEYLSSNVALLKNMIARGYNDARTLARRIKVMEDWLANPQLLQADDDAQYAEVIEINLDELTEPVLACPNDPEFLALRYLVMTTRMILQTLTTNLMVLTQNLITSKLPLTVLREFNSSY
jgi:aconitase B